MTIRQHFKSNVSNVKLTSTDIACGKARRQDLREHPSWSSVSSRQNEDCLSGRQHAPEMAMQSSIVLRQKHVQLVKYVITHDFERFKKIIKKKCIN